MPTATGAADPSNTREAWLDNAAQLLVKMGVNPALTRAELPTLNLNEVRISVGRCTSKNAIAECWARSRSQDNVNEIFVTPTTDNSPIIVLALAHELIHAADDCESGHRGKFAIAAHALGFTSPLTTPNPTDDLMMLADDIVDALGDIPHAKLDTTPPKKQSTRMRKVHCPACGFSFRTTATHIAKMQYWDCLSCENGQLQEAD